MALSLYNTLTRRVEPLRPADRSRVTFYTCGPTVYDDAHIGNFRSFLAADLLRRWIESPLCELEGETAEEREREGRRVRHVMNITDVGHMTEDERADGGGEDKMAVAGRRLLEAKKTGRLPEGARVDPSDPYAIAEFYAARFREDARALGMRVAIEAEDDPGLMPRATRFVQDSSERLGMIGVIARLIGRGHAYEVGEAGSRVVYFDVQSFSGYGSLSGNTLERLRAGEGGRISEANQAQKRHPADFLLWKEDPTHIMRWESPWGEGYPGWHVECTAMSIAQLVAPHELEGLFASSSALIDIHSGGEDNIFPHHECEIAQSACCFNADPSAGGFARMWFHPRFLLVDGEKMSKSRGTFYTVRDLMEMGHEPAAIRLELIKTHYRSNANFTMQGLKDSARMVERWRRFGEALPGGEGDAREHPVAAEFAAAMGEDLNIAGALGVMNSWIRATRDPSMNDSELFNEFGRVLGTVDAKATVMAQAEIRTAVGVSFSARVIRNPAKAPKEIIDLVSERSNAREAKDFARADELRDEIRRLGYLVKDSSDGDVEVSRV